VLKTLLLCRRRNRRSGARFQKPRAVRRRVERERSIDANRSMRSSTGLRENSRLLFPRPGFNSDPVVHRRSNPLGATEVPFFGLGRVAPSSAGAAHMTEKLPRVGFAAGYQSVRRFFRKLQGSPSLEARVPSAGLQSSESATRSHGSPVFFSVAFVSSRRISFSDALPRWEFECKLSSNFRSSASAAAAIAGPTVRWGLFVGSAIHDGNPPMVPSGNSQKRYSPFVSFARRSTRRL
jgi:hypothetical protein